MESPSKRSKGRGRGVLALKSYEPCPRPSPLTIGSWHDSPNRQKDKEVNIKSSKSAEKNRIGNEVIPIHNGISCDEKKTERDTVQVSKDNTFPNQSSSLDFPPGCLKLLAKYNYRANIEKAGGFEELTIKQGEKLKLIQKGHKETKNPLWWEVQNANGEQGFVPASYCMPLEETPTTLPWLENKRLLEEKERKEKEKEMAKKGIGFGGPPPKPQVKTYQSAYSAPAAKSSVEASKEFYCEICDKALNGPQPYKSHMSSKAHREEVEYLKSKSQ